jgi:hypothetical protein
MIPYWLLFLVFAIGAASHRKETGQAVSTPLFALCGLLMAAMIGLRFEVGPDWVGYSYIFEGVGRQRLATAFAHGDPGFTALILLAKHFDLQIWSVNLVCAAFFTIGLAVFAKQQSNPWLAVAVAVPYLVVVIAMSTTRQATAIGFILLSLAAFHDKSALRFVMWIFIAALFHASALLMLPIVGLSYTRNRFQSVVLLCIAAVPAYYLLAGNVEVYIHRYSNKFVESEGALYRVVMNAIPAVLFLFLKDRYTRERHEWTLWRNLSILALLCIPVLLLFPSSTALDRAALYIIPLQMYVLGNFPSVIAQDKEAYLTITLGLIGYLGLVLFVYLNFSAHGKYYVPYQVYPIF